MGYDEAAHAATSRIGAGGVVGGTGTMDAAMEVIVSRRAKGDGRRKTRNTYGRTKAGSVVAHIKGMARVRTIPHDVLPMGQG